MRRANTLKISRLLLVVAVVVVFGVSANVDGTEIHASSSSEEAENAAAKRSIESSSDQLSSASDEAEMHIFGETRRNGRRPSPPVAHKQLNAVSLTRAGRESSATARRRAFPNAVAALTGPTPAPRAHIALVAPSAIAQSGSITGTGPASRQRQAARRGATVVATMAALVQPSGSEESGGETRLRTPPRAERGRASGGSREQRPSPTAVSPIITTPTQQTRRGRNRPSSAVTTAGAVAGQPAWNLNDTNGGSDSRGDRRARVSAGQTSERRSAAVPTLEATRKPPTTSATTTPHPGSGFFNFISEAWRNLTNPTTTATTPTTNTPAAAPSSSSHKPPKKYHAPSEPNQAASNKEAKLQSLHKPKHKLSEQHSVGLVAVQPTQAVKRDATPSGGASGGGGGPFRIALPTLGLMASTAKQAAGTENANEKEKRATYTTLRHRFNCPRESEVRFQLFPKICRVDKDCSIWNREELCCDIFGSKSCVNGIPKPLEEFKHTPLLGVIPRKCPTRPLAELWWDVQECDRDMDCWPRICCPDGRRRYCRSSEPELDMAPVPVKRSFHYLTEYLECTPPPPPIFDLHPRACTSTLDCFPNVCCQEAGLRHCRPPKKSVLTLMANVLNVDFVKRITQNIVIK